MAEIALSVVASLIAAVLWHYRHSAARAAGRGLLLLSALCLSASTYLRAGGDLIVVLYIPHT